MVDPKPVLDYSAQPTGSRISIMKEGEQTVFDIPPESVGNIVAFFSWYLLWCSPLLVFISWQIWQIGTSKNSDVILSATWGALFGTFRGWVNVILFFGVLPGSFWLMRYRMIITVRTSALEVQSIGRFWRTSRQWPLSEIREVRHDWLRTIILTQKGKIVAGLGNMPRQERKWLAGQLSEAIKNKQALQSQF